jgi:hypothetical protein
MSLVSLYGTIFSNKTCDGFGKVKTMNLSINPITSSTDSRKQTRYIIPESVFAKVQPRTDLSQYSAFDWRNVIKHRTPLRTNCTAHYAGESSSYCSPDSGVVLSGVHLL